MILSSLKPSWTWDGSEKHVSNRKEAIHVIIKMKDRPRRLRHFFELEL